MNLLRQRKNIFTHSPRYIKYIKFEILAMVNSLVNFSCV